MDGGHIEQENKTHEDEDGREEADAQKDEFPPPVEDPEGDERHDCVGEKKPKDEPEKMSVVVDPGQEAGEEEDGRDSDQLENGHLGVLETRPLVDHLDNAAGE